MAKVLIAESLDEEGVELLKRQPDLRVDVKTGLSHDELVQKIADYDALIVRSGAQVTEEVIRAGKNLQVIARAGVGVDNIDLDAATANGIAVVNAPTGNTIAAVEHTLALMLALSRNVPQAHESLKAGSWSRSAFIGVEIRNKALGIVGLGRVGSEVARRAQSFGMRVLGYDPFINPEAARLLGIELTSLDNLFEESDFITLHTPLTPGTQNLINDESLAKMKPGARLINVARGELVDSEAVRKALDEGRLAGAAVDVFPTEPPGDDEPLINHPKVIATPHLGASTREAQREVAIEVAEQVIAVLSGVSARNTVNAPFMPPEVHAVVAPFIPVADILGRLLTSLAEGQFLGVTIGYQGEIANHDTTLLTSTALTGLLKQVTDARVNQINAPLIAQRHGWKVSENKDSDHRHHGSLLSITLNTTVGGLTLAGTSLRDEVHLVSVDEYWLDITLTGVHYLLFVEQQDKPGSIGAVGAIAGQNDINISFMQVGRLSPRGRAMMIIGVDDPVPPHVLDQIRDLEQIDTARLVHL